MNDKISESFVRLLFSELKDSDTENKNSIKDLTISITELLKIFGNNPNEIINKLDKISKLQQDLHIKYERANYRFNIIIAVFGVLTLIIKFMDWFIKTQ